MKTTLTYIVGFLLVCLSAQLLISCDPWVVPTKKTQRNCQKPDGELKAQPQQKQVDFSISNTIGTIDQVAWDFGNGSTTATSGMTVRYTYPTSGTYTVKANLTNTCDNRTTLQTTVVVSDAVLPTVTLQPVTGISTNAANVGMMITSNGNATITRYGVCYSSTNQVPNITNDNMVLGTTTAVVGTSYPFSLTGLAPNSTYYLRSFAENSAGINYSSPVRTFSTGSVPSVTTGGATPVGVTTASVIFVLNNPGNPAAIEYGILYSTSNTFDDNNTLKVIVPSPNVGANTVINLINLIPNTKYYYRAYAKQTNTSTPEPGTIQSFTTQVDAVAQDLIAHVTFTNRSLVDLTGNNNHAILVDNPTFTADRKGNANSAVQLDGVNDYFYMNDNNSLQPDALSISVWIKPIEIKNALNRVQIYNKSRWNDSSGEMYSSLIKLNENGPGLTFMTNVKQNSGCRVAQGWEPFQFSSNFQLNTWHHLVFTYSNRSVRMYFDNVLVDQRDNMPAPSIDKCPGGELKFGAQIKDFPNYFNGAMDDIRIYKRALTDSEVQTLYNATN